MNQFLHGKLKIKAKVLKENGNYGVKLTICFLFINFSTFFKINVFRQLLEFLQNVEFEIIAKQEEEDNKKGSQC